MRTNIKNGIILLDQVATDTTTIRIGKIEPSNLDLKFTTKADGFILFLLRQMTKEWWNVFSLTLIRITGIYLRMTR